MDFFSAHRPRERVEGCNPSGLDRVVPRLLEDLPPVDGDALVEENNP